MSLSLAAIILAATAVPVHSFSETSEQTATTGDSNKPEEKIYPVFLKMLKDKVAANDNKHHEIIIEVFDGLEDDQIASAKSKLADILDEKGASKVRVLESIPFIIAKLSPGKILELPEYEGIKAIGDGEEEGVPLGELEIGNDASEDRNFLGLEQPQLIQPDMDIARQVVRANLVTQTGSGEDLAIMDSGIHLCGSSSTCHPDFAGRVTNVFDYTGAGYNDGNGHGTALATIAAASGTESSGTYKGMAPSVRILNFKLWDDTHPATSANVVDALDRAITHPNKAEVILLAIAFSCGSASTGYSIRHAVDAAVERGVTIVTGPGNTGAVGAIASPGCAFNVITAGAIDDNDSTSSSSWVMWSGSNQGPTFDSLTKPDIVAPGEGLHVLKKDANPNDSLSLQYYDTGGGTSYSAAAAAGVAVLVYDKNPTWTPAQIKAAIKQTADPYSLPSGENVRGKGVIDAYDAINLSASSINFANAYALTVPTTPSTSTYTARERSGDVVQYKFSKQADGQLSIVDGKLKSTSSTGTVFKTISFPGTKISSITQVLTDSKLLAGPRVEKGASFAYAYVTYKISSTDTVKLLWAISSGTISPIAIFTSTTSKTFENTQYMDFDMTSTNTNDKATPATSPYTPYSQEIKFTSGTDFHVRDTNFLTQPWLKVNDQGVGTINEWILKWKSGENPTNNPDALMATPLDSLDGSGDGENIVVYYRGSRTGTSLSINPTVNVNWSSAPI